MFQLVERNTEEGKTVHWKITALWGGLEVPGYTFRVFVTNLVLPPEEIWPPERAQRANYP